MTIEEINKILEPIVTEVLKPHLNKKTSLTDKQTEEVYTQIRNKLPKNIPFEKYQDMCNWAVYSYNSNYFLLPISWKKLSQGYNI